MLSSNIERYHINNATTNNPASRSGSSVTPGSRPSIGSIGTGSFFGIRRPVPPPLPPMPPAKQNLNSGNYLSAEPPICQRERSTSAPNVSFNLVNLNGATQLVVQNMMGSSAAAGGPGATGYYDQESAADTYGGGDYPTQDPNSLGPPNYTEDGRIHSDSPNNVQGRNWRPRARSADESSKKKIRQNQARDSLEDWEIRYEEILQGPKIGSGSFGTVYQGHWHGHVALKKLKVAKPTKEQLQVCVCVKLTK